jgi:hypothetical protein
MWKANGKTTTLQLFLDSLSPKLDSVWKRLWACRETDKYLIATYKLFYLKATDPFCYLIRDGVLRLFLVGFFSELPAAQAKERREAGRWMNDQLEII